MPKIIFKNIKTIALLIFTLLATCQAQEINILFMGNSFTFRHDLPELVKEVFEEGEPDLTVNVDRIVYGGQDLFRHHDLYFSESMLRLNSITVPEIEELITRIKSLRALEKAPDFYNEYWKKTGLGPISWDLASVQANLRKSETRQQNLIDRIQNNGRVKWDYIVLQSWKDVVGNVDAGYAEYAQKFAKTAAKEGIKVILYITAPHAQNAKPVDAPVELEQTEMELTTIQQLVERINPFATIPVALGMKMIQQNGTNLTFRYVNDMHPNQYGAFLTANMFYAAFFKESTEGFNFNTVVETKLDKDGKNPDGGDAKVVFSKDTKILFQKTAYNAIMEFDAGFGKHNKAEFLK